ncbi:DUF5677 domain-containing protein [Microbacterium nymphoidis]|uniref:DUF5677 domain-containing protein n=1 Tax=Microbacterium nymphoidis TaxID=2898586 RepID=UPI001E5C3C6F|nr:DUF5677 domain-containing protein [Microbacterium nymphoidis]MCD2496883.1 DUF5677 domain-containing protein [Microbacterium nymphoidis]
MTQNVAEPREVIDDALQLLSRFSTRIGRGWRDPDGLLDLVDNALYEIEGDLHDLGERSRKEFLSVPALIREDVGPFPLYEASAFVHASVHLVADTWGQGVSESSQYVFSGLVTRAIATMREIAVLLEHGYSSAATSRWRTLSEILVVARVIRLGDRHTASRYQHHRWIVLAGDRAKSRDFEWDGHLPTPEIMKKRLVRRFGADYGGLYGWAARVTARRLGTSRPTWRDLQKLANVGEHASRVLQAHHAVHGADSFGLLGSVDLTSGQFHAGASPHQVIPVAADSTRLFRQTVSALFEICAKYSTARKPQVIQGIVEAHLFNLEQQLMWRVLEQDHHARERYIKTMNKLWDEVRATGVAADSKSAS